MPRPVRSRSPSPGAPCPKDHRADARGPPSTPYGWGGSRGIRSDRPGASSVRRTAHGAAEARRPRSRRRCRAWPRRPAVASPDAARRRPPAGAVAACGGAPRWSRASSARLVGALVAGGIVAVAVDDDSGSSSAGRHGGRACGRPTASRAPVTSPTILQARRPRGRRHRRRRRTRLRRRRRHRLRDLVRRRHRHQQPRRRGRATRSRPCSPTARRATPRCSASDPASDLAVVQGRRHGPPHHRARRLRPGAGR